MRWVFLVVTLVLSVSFTSEARTPTASEAEIKRACKKYLALSPKRQTAIAKISKKHTRKQMLWACGVILSRGGTGGGGSSPGSSRSTPQPESSWQCRAEGEVGHQPVSGTGIADSQATAQAYAISNCPGDCRATTCLEGQQGPSTSQWYCWAEGYSHSRKEIFDGYNQSDRSSGERSALSACSGRARDCSIVSCSSR